MKPYKVDYDCPRCDETIKVDVTPYEGPKYMSGRMEDAEPAEGGYCEPEECPLCACSIDYEDVAEQE
jgi:hypothetical protein